MFGQNIQSYCQIVGEMFYFDVSFPYSYYSDMIIVV